METNRIKLKDFLSLFSEDTLIDIVYHHMSECGFTAKELFVKRPELENKYIQPNGIEIRKDKLDYILAENSEERKHEIFDCISQNEYTYLIIVVED